MTQRRLPFDDSCETIFTKVGAASTVNYIVEQKDAEYGLFGRVEEMSEPVSVTCIISFLGKANEHRRRLTRARPRGPWDGWFSNISDRQ